MKRLGNPHTQFKSIHIAGTNGKGSTAAFLSTILRQAGYTVGLYTSPHLIRFNERIQINRVEIGDRELISLTQEIRSVLHELQPTLFEFTTALAFLYFQRRKVDIAIVEVGMGGRLDATNVILPLVSVITNVSLDHTQYLGTSKTEIANEKVGIIKPGCPVVTNEKDEEIISIIRKKCEENKSRLWKVSEHLVLEKYLSSPQELCFTTAGIINRFFSTKMVGLHQLENANTAILTAILLKKQGIALSDKAIQEGILKTYWPGRLEIIYTRPLVIVDGAHNSAGVGALHTFLKSIPQPKVLLLGISKDKPVEEMVSLLAPLAKSIIISQGNYKPMDMDTLEKACRKYTPVEIFKIAEVKKALSKALQETNLEDMLLVTGSLYLVGDVLKIIRNST